MPSTAEHLRHELEGLFNDYAVDLVFSGHVHSYARTCNVLDERCVDMDDGGTTHITLGCGGHTLCVSSTSPNPVVFASCMRRVQTGREGLIEARCTPPLAAAAILRE